MFGYYTRRLFRKTVEFFVEYLSAGNLELEYLIQTRLPGTFEVKPAKVQEMYYPEVFGTSEGMKVTIEE